MPPRISRGRHSTARVLSVLLGWLAFASPASATEAYSDDAVKAAFLARFAEYVEWPPDAPAAARFTIAVLGAEEIALDLQRLLPGYAIKNLPAQVRKIHSVQELGDSRILFVGADQGDALRTVAAKIAGRPVLLVTDQPSGIDAGGMVNFVLIDNHVRFEVSLPAAERSRLRISSELLAVAFRVQTGHQGSTGPSAPGLVGGTAP